MLTEQELAQFAELAKKFEMPQLDTVKGLVQTHLHPVFQAINDGGRAAANQTNKQRLEELTGQVTQLTEQKSALDGEIRSLRDKSPDVKELTLRHEQALADLKQQHTTELATMRGQLVTSHRGRAVADLVAELTSDKFKVDPEYANTVIAQRPDVLNRLKVGQDGTTSVLQQGQQELTITPAPGRTAIGHLAEELAGTIDDRWKRSGVDRGPNATPGGAAESARFEQLRSSVRATDEARQAAKQNAQSGLARLRGTTMAEA